MKSSVKNEIIDVIKKHQTIKLAIIYGSVAEGRETRHSDLDVGIAGTQIYSADLMMEIIEELAQITGRPIDLVDLNEVHGTILKQILTKGSILFNDNTTLYAGIMKRMLFEDTDFMPYYYRILKTQRERWIDK